MRVVIDVRDNESVIGQGVVRDVGCKLSEWDNVCRLARALLHVRKIDERIVMLNVGSRIRAEITHRWQRLGVTFPSFSCGRQSADNVVLRHRAGVVISLAAGNRRALADGQHEVVRQRGVRVRVILRRQAICRSKSVQIRHVRVSDHIRETMIFFDHKKHVIKVRDRASTAAAPTTTPASTAGTSTTPSSSAAASRSTRGVVVAPATAALKKNQRED